jgi:hypothetical protein
MTVPGIVMILNSVLLNLISMDILLTDLWLPDIFYGPYSSSEDSEALNDFIDENGFKSKFSIKNLGSALVYFILYIGLWVIILILKFFVIKSINK